MLTLAEWRQYRELDPVAFGQVVTQKRVLDGRNALDREARTAVGWTYRDLGRRARRSTHSTCSTLIGRAFFH